MDYQKARYLKCLEIMPESTNSIKSGNGIINSAINGLPFELHMPGYKYLGPGTKLEKRLTRGDEPKNKLDELAMKHDIAYSKSNNLKDRHEADYALQEGAWNRVLSKDAGLGEKAVAWLTTNAMKIKRKIGAGVLTKHPVSLDGKQQEKLISAVNAQKPVVLTVSKLRTKESVMNETYLPLTKSQITNLKKGGTKLKLSVSQVKKIKSGGYLKTILQYGPTAIGLVSSIVSALKSDKKKETEGKGVYIRKRPKSGSGIVKKRKSGVKKKAPAGKGVYINKKPKGGTISLPSRQKKSVPKKSTTKGNGLLQQLLKKKKTLH